MGKDKKKKTKREFNPKAKQWIKNKRNGAMNWTKEHKDSLDAMTSVLEFVVAAGGVGGLATKAKKVISKNIEE